MGRKLQDSRGETLVEVLASVLIASLSAALLFGAVMASLRLNRSARSTDDTFYDALSKAEAQTDAGLLQEAALQILWQEEGLDQTLTLPIRLYGGEGAVSYAPEGGGGP